MLLFKIYRKVFEICDSLASLMRVMHYRLKYPKLQINFASHISRGCQIICSDDSEMILENVYLAANVHLKTDRGGKMKISDSFIGIGSIIVAAESIEIREYCEIAEMVVIRDQDHRFGNGELLRHSGMDTAPILIEKNVWIGAKATILKGITIGENTVIGANAVVTKNISNNSVAIGVPAKLLVKTPNIQLS